MDLFDDALSEDWISQPGSSGTPSVKDDSLISNARGGSAGSMTLPPSRSRRSGSSFLESRRTGSARQHSALSEKRASQLNTKRPETGDNLTKAPLPEDSSFASSRSSQSVRQGTVQQRSKTVSGTQARHATPEWKRRLLATRSRSSQRDLFSPMELENVFEAPGSSKEAPSIPVAKAGKTPPTAGASHSNSPVTALKKMNNDSPKRTKGFTSPKRIEAGASPLQREMPSPKPSLLPIRRAQAASKLAISKPTTLDSTSLEEAKTSSNNIEGDKSREEVYKATSDLQSLLDNRSGEESPDTASPQDGSLTETQPFVTFNRGKDHSDITPLDRSFDSSPPPLPRADSFDRHNQSQEEGSTAPPLELSPSKMKSSPLKLFGKYDTYTNNRLAHRVTQLEDDELEGSEVQHTTENTANARPRTDSGEPYHERMPRKRRVVSNFGIGELDDYAFEHDDTSGIIIDTETQSTAYSRRTSKTVTKTASLPSLNGHLDYEIYAIQSEEQQDPRNDEGKRILNSPRRVPEPKRRRTSLPVPDSVDGTLDQPLREYYEVDQYVVGKKRKDARYDENWPTASPEVIASRQILQPKGPYSLSRRAVSIAKGDAASEPDSSDGLALVPLKNASDGSFHAPGNTDLNQGTRKKSVTTADFFKEANLIMRNIRAQAQSPLLPATEDGFSPDASILYNEEFTMEQLSRPASREGSYRRRLPYGRPLNARVVSHLRKFEETEEADLALGSSFRSEQGITEGSPILSEKILSDPPNTRILEQRRRNDAEDRADGAGHTFHSQSSGQGTDRSIPTASSGLSSAPKATISPDKVSHLLSRTMGSMTFDEAKGCWIKMKASQNMAADSELNDEDPFNAIPDLTIDESQEILAVRGVFPRPSLGRTRSQPATLQGQGATPSKDTAVPFMEEPSSAVSKYTRFTSSGPMVETRATSWGDAALRQNKNEGLRGQITEQAASVVIQPILAEAEEEPIVDTVGASRSSTPTKAPPRWAHSTPSAKSDGEVDYDSFSFEPPPAYITPRPSERHVSFIRTSTMPTHEEEQATDGGDDFEAAQFEPSASCLARIPERDDLQLAVATPIVASKSVDSLLAQPFGNLATPGDLQLTPLPDFTVNQPDESLQLDVGYIAKRHGIFSREAVEGRFSLAIRELVQKIQDVEPHEPYWEFLRKINLRKRNLMTLHMLNEFCSRIEELDVADNQLGQLNGAPLGLRVLNVPNNCLSSLTAWHHLPNLQYLNVSGNRITSTKAFTSLVHLRELNLEANAIEDIDEILGMDNLISLNVAHNNIKKLDFRRANLPHLTSLDVHGNSVASARGFAQLSALQELNLQANKLEEFLFDDANLPQTLRHLDLSGNQLSHVDLKGAPNLSSLVVDRNRLQVLTGLDGLPSVEIVSWAHQDLSQPGTMQIECCAQVQVLDLSGNAIPQFAPKVPFLNLRRLELASCGLDSLKPDLGSWTPNLRVLKLNDNGLKSLAPLRGMVTLEELHVARNRLARLRQSISVVHCFAQTLRVLDMRDNPITLAFYPEPRRGLGHSTNNEDTEAGPCARCNAGLRAVALPMPPTSDGDDQQYQKRLDEDTLMRRRVYEALVVCKCTKLKSWDGMAAQQRRAVAAKISKRLVELGVLRKRDDGIAPDVA